MKNKEIAKLQAQINLLSDQLQGMEELVIHVLEERAAARDPNRWARTQVMAEA